MAVWDDLVGQQPVVEELSAAATSAAAVVAGSADASAASRMTHAWLVTGPPGAGRSTAARAFSAALQCTSPDVAMGAAPGCGFCDGCHTTLVGTHADVEVVRAELLTIGVKDTRELVRRANLAPAGGRWQVILLEDADRLTEGAANVLLKAVEEPAPRTVWLLCAPSQEDVLPTIRSRCRQLRLRTPSDGAVADMLMRRDGIDPEMARYAAQAARGHLGLARRLATDESARARRAEVLRVPLSVGDIGGCLRSAQLLVEAATEDAKQLAEETDAKEQEEMRAALGAAAGAGGRLPRGTAGIMKDLQDRQKRRATRTQRDTLDRALGDIAGFYRDVLAVQLGAPVPATSDDGLREAVASAAGAGAPEATLRRIEAVLACRTALERNVAPLLAVEAMALALWKG
ncbi:DNA polymerase III subunit delta' [Mangrovactinospora gilvigrisea]|uniref:DNA polymerase III subunit delta n=1 Tax=Mangrovactinospora gilvigrisea TaxID=1428644 RepID=A0A1J7BCK3_9ACTN|nr:DNA polymerase III subunit delta' [Mangrovactinospora gilvigrisea]OIV36317.1 DNA polymerase III subunit delta' [Mangrovactinospora gilvigrisea]